MIFDFIGDFGITMGDFPVKNNFVAFGFTAKSYILNHVILILKSKK